MVTLCHESKMVTDHIFIWFVDEIKVVDDEKQVEVNMNHNEPKALTHVRNAKAQNCSPCRSVKNATNSSY